MTAYENCLIAIERLLLAVGVKYWAERIRQDIDDWHSSGDTSNHLSRYGGMGSFNDIVICRDNHLNVTAAQEPWADSVFQWLRSVCFYLARNPEAEPTVETLIEAVGRHDSCLAAFVGGENVPKFMRGFANEIQLLNGSRCLRCGYIVVTRHIIESFIAQEIIPSMVFHACAQHAMPELVDEILALNVKGLAEIRQQVLAAINAGGIPIDENVKWVHTCPKCGGDEVSGCRLKWSLESPTRFELSEDNLPSRE